MTFFGAYRYYRFTGLSRIESVRRAYKHSMYWY